MLSINSVKINTLPNCLFVPLKLGAMNKVNIVIVFKIRG